MNEPINRWMQSTLLFKRQYQPLIGRWQPPPTMPPALYAIHLLAKETQRLIGNSGMMVVTEWELHPFRSR